MHSDVEALALLTQQIFLGDTAILEDQLVCGRTTDTHLLLFGTECEAGSSFLYDKCRDFFHLAAALFNNTGYSEDNVNVSFLTVCDEALGTI